MQTDYSATEPTRAEVEAHRGPLLLEFGAPWCPHCRAVQPLLADALEEMGDVAHIKIEDGPGRPLGRSFRVKLWPTLIFLRDGEERGRLVRPDDAGQIRANLRQVR